jgi:hypothetical protein
MSQVPMNLPFEQLTSYEKPMVLLTQALDNELTVRGALQTLADSDGLSPKERDLFTDRLKNRVGRNAVTDTVIDIVTNPFVLLMAATTPVGGQALSRTGKAIFDMAERFSPMVKEQGGLHAALGLLAPMQLFRGTALTPAVNAVTKGVGDLERQMLDTVGEPLRKVLEKHGLESLNHEMVRDPAKKDLAKRMNHALHASLNGMDKEYKSARAFLKKKKDGTWRMGMKETDVPRLVAQDMDQEIGRLGLTELRDAYRKALRDRYIKTHGDEAASAVAGKFVPDEQKLLRQVQGVKMGFKADGVLRGTGSEVTAMLMGPEVAMALSKGEIAEDQVMGFLKTIIEKHPEFYLPRNVIDVKGARSMADVLEQRRSRSLVATGSTLSRSSTLGNWDPDDLKEVYGMFGSTEAGEKMLAASQRKVQKMLDRGRVVRTYRVNAQESLSRYFRDTGFTHALYVQTADQFPMVQQAIKDTRGMAKPEKVKAMEGQLYRSPLMDDRKSLAQLLQEEHYLLEDRFAKESLEVVLRGAAGVQKVEHVATHMALIRGKEALGRMLESPIGKAMQKAGKWGQGLHDRLKGVVDSELSFGEAKGISGALARYFYVTHLGLNLSSVTMNMMQPLLMASTWGGLGNVMKAYTAAFKEMGGYISERVGKYGFKALTDEQHGDLIRKHFKYANVDGENLVQIGRDSFSTLDNISYKSEGLAGVARKESYFYDYPMKLFEKAEWLNRNVAAHTVENLYRGKGIDISKGSEGYLRMLRDVGENVSATQFGGSTLNTPMMFQGVGPFGRLGNNPLMRQFLSFPVRSVTSLTFDSPRLGGRGFVKGVGQDFVRGMGTSAIFYEIGKNTFGVDLSQGLYGSSLTQVVGGDRFFQDGNEYIPIPPVVDIPVNIVRGMLDPGQRELLQNNIPRLIPGGIALSRTLNLMPNLPESPVFGLPGALQKTYVDFKQRTPDGMVAVFKADGTLVDYQSPGMIFAKQLGVDMGKFRETGDFDGYLLKNREQIVEYRRRAIQALLSNEIPKMRSVQAEFERRFGIKLTISKDQLDEAMKNRVVSRTERIMDRMPPELRSQYQAMAAGRAEHLGLQSEDITGAETARQRMQNRRIEARPLTVEQQQIMQQESGFTPFSGY